LPWLGNALRDAHGQWPDDGCSDLAQALILSKLLLTLATMRKRAQSINVGDTVRLAVEVVRTDDKTTTVEVAGRRVTFDRDNPQIESVAKDRFAPRGRSAFYDRPD
jgi:hypothetical protein